MLGLRCACVNSSIGASRSWEESNDVYMADSRFAPSQWEMPLLCNGISHWLGASLESAQCIYIKEAKWLFADIPYPTNIPCKQVSLRWDLSDTKGAFQYKIRYLVIRPHSLETLSDNKDPQIDVNQTSILHLSVELMSNWWRSKGPCYPG